VAQPPKYPVPRRLWRTTREQGGQAARQAPGAEACLTLSRNARTDPVAQGAECSFPATSSPVPNMATRLPVTWCPGDLRGALGMLLPLQAKPAEIIGRGARGAALALAVTIRSISGYLRG
jgi:hypothetical protein